MSVKLHFVTERMVEIYLTEDEVRFISLITNVNFNNVECVPHSKAKFIARKLTNYGLIRKQSDLERCVKYYNLPTITWDSIGHLARQFDAADEVKCGVCVTVC